MILIALCKGNSLHHPSKAVLPNLVTTDLYVGVVEFFLVGKWISILQERWQNLSLLLSCLHLGSFYCDIWVTMDINSCRCGQNISSVVRTQIQAGCNPSESLYSGCSSLAFRYWQRHSCNYVSGCSKSFRSIRDYSEFDNIFFLLHQNFF